MIAQTPGMRVLLVGYDATAEFALAGELESLGCEVAGAPSEEHAITVLRRHKIACALVDVASPSLHGIDSVRRLATVEPNMALLVASAAHDPELAVSCVQHGALDYLRLPVDGARLEPAIRCARDRRRSYVRQAQCDRILREELARYTVRLHRLKASAAKLSLGALESLVHMMEVRDPYLAGHSMRVAQLAASMAAELGRTVEEIEQVRLAGKVHDIGMLCIGDGILSKAGTLTEQEVSRVRQHVVIADELLAQLPLVKDLRAFIRSHHERWDGGGYPDALRGDAIPWGSRLIGAAEIFDALTTARSYQRALPLDDAIDHMGRLSGTAVSPEGYDALTRIVGRREALVFIDAEDGSKLGAIETGTTPIETVPRLSA